MGKTATEETTTLRKRSNRVAKTSQDCILDAAERVILKNGYNGATLENMAHEAGFSKGGLMHHYHSKLEVVCGLLDRMERRFLGTREKIASLMPQSNCPMARASILSYLHLLKYEPVMLGSIVEMLGETVVRMRLTELRHKLFVAISAGSRRPERVAVALLLVEGLCLDNCLRPSPFREDVVAAIFAELTKFLDSLESDFA